MTLETNGKDKPTPCALKIFLSAKCWKKKRSSHNAQNECHGILCISITHEHGVKFSR